MPPTDDRPGTHAILTTVLNELVAQVEVRPAGPVDPDQPHGNAALAAPRDDLVERGDGRAVSNVGVVEADLVRLASA